jgi:hypothetical protein
MKPPGLVTAGHAPVEYDRHNFIYLSRGGGYVKWVWMLLWLYRFWMRLLWFLRLA